jgi:hypothetical protein
MNQEILAKLHTALATITPLATDREKIIEDMGQTVWIEALEKMLMALPEDVRGQAVTALNENDIDKAVELFESHNVDVDVILQEVAQSVLDDVTSVE